MEAEANNRRDTRVRGSTRGDGTADERLLQWGNRKRLRCVKVHRRGVAAAATAAAEKAAASQRRAAAAALQNRGLRNSEEGSITISSAQQQQNYVFHVVASPDMAEHPVRGESNGNLSPPPDIKKATSSGSEWSMWANFAIALTNKEKDEDFLVFKGSRPPLRPKKRAKIIQKTVNLVCPGTWLCDLTLERYEVREKKASRKRPRGLKALRSMQSDSE